MVPYQTLDQNSVMPRRSCWQIEEPGVRWKDLYSVDAAAAPQQDPLSTEAGRDLKTAWC